MIAEAIQLSPGELHSRASVYTVVHPVHTFTSITTLSSLSFFHVCRVMTALYSNPTSTVDMTDSDSEDVCLKAKVGAHQSPKVMRSYSGTRGVTHLQSAGSLVNVHGA